MKSSKYSGVLPPVTTPFINEELALDKLTENLRRFNRTGLSGYLILGSNGENVFLSEAEKIAVFETAREAIPTERLFMAGVGLDSTRETVKLTNTVADIGADCALVVTPYYFKGGMTSERLRYHFSKIADEAKIPVLLYNVPQFTGVNIAPDLVAELSSHPNIVGIKDSSGNIIQLAEIVRNSEPGFAVFVGSGPVFLPALVMGAAGGIIGGANVMPDLLVEVQTLFEKGALEEARKMQDRITPLAQWVTVGKGIGGLKMAMDEVGYFGGEPRRPLTRPPDSARAELKIMLSELGL